MTINKRKKLMLSAGIVSVLIITNIPIVSVFIGLITGTESLKNGVNAIYSSESSGFVVASVNIPGTYAKDKYPELIKRFEQYKKHNPSDSILYRNYRRNPLRFWMWYRYWLDRDNPMYQLPYRPLMAKADM